MATKKYLTTNQAAEYMNTSKYTVLNLVKKRMIPFIKVGKTYSFDVEDLMAYMDSQKQSAVRLNNLKKIV